MQHGNVRHYVFASLLTRDRFLLVVVILLGVFGTLGTLGIGNTVVNATTLSVSTTGTDSGTCGTSGTPCHTIQKAVDNAAAGTYIEQVSIAKSLTFTGAGHGVEGTIIKASTITALSPTAVVVIGTQEVTITGTDSQPGTRHGG